MVTSLEKRIDDADKKCAETIRVSEERLKNAVEAESKINNMNKEMQRFLISFWDLVLQALFLRFSWRYFLHAWFDQNIMDSWLTPFLILFILYHRLQEKLLNMESENQILRQQTLLNSPVKRMSEHLSIPTTPTKQVLCLKQCFCCSINFYSLFNLFLMLLIYFPCRIWITATLISKSLRWLMHIMLCILLYLSLPCSHIF